MNFVHYTPEYDSYESVPRWADRRSASTASDKREYAYSRDNSSPPTLRIRTGTRRKMEMLLSGFMHNYMRMYWGKKVLEWKRTPQEAFEDLLYLNNKYFICGRDPNFVCERRVDIRAP